jgi:hypothetical protein
MTWYDDVGGKGTESKIPEQFQKKVYKTITDVNCLQVGQQQNWFSLPKHDRANQCTSTTI